MDDGPSSNAVLTDDRVQYFTIVLLCIAYVIMGFQVYEQRQQIEDNQERIEELQTIIRTDERLHAAQNQEPSHNPVSYNIEEKKQWSKR